MATAMPMKTDAGTASRLRAPPHARESSRGRDAALWLGRSAGRLRLAELGKRVGDLDYAVVSKAISRFEQRLRVEPELRQELANIQLQLSK